MADKHSKEVRSYNMSMVMGKNTTPEMLVRKFRHANGFRYRIHQKDLLGKPDIILPKHKTLIFVNGYFWHGHENCKYAVTPKTNTEFWLDKINRNVLHDKKVIKILKNAGWKILIVWQCQLKKIK